MSDTELLLKSEPVRRVEVFTGAGRRRTWTAEEKVGIVAESYAGGETVSAVARRHGLTPQQLFGWRRAAATGTGARAGICAGDCRGSAVSCERGAAIARLGDAGDRDRDRGDERSCAARCRCRDVAGRTVRREGDVMIIPSGAVRVLVATRPVDFRKGMDGLAAVVRRAWAAILTAV